MQNGTILRCDKCQGKMKVVNSRVVLEEELLYKRRRYICNDCRNITITREPLDNMQVCHYKK
jgi:transcriptional regulator NrdR family protein